MDSKFRNVNETYGSMWKFCLEFVVLQNFVHSLESYNYLPNK